MGKTLGAAIPALLSRSERLRRFGGQRANTGQPAAKRRTGLVFKHRNVGIMKPNGSYIPLPATERGIADIIGCLPSGRFIAIEVKRKGNKPSPEQLEFLDTMHRNNGIGLVAYSLDEVMKLL